MEALAAVEDPIDDEDSHDNEEIGSRDVVKHGSYEASVCRRFWKLKV